MGTILDTPSGQYKITIVDRVEGMNVHIGSEVLQISHPRRKAFFEAFAQFMEAHRL